MRDWYNYEKSLADGSRNPKAVRLKNEIRSLETELKKKHEEILLAEQEAEKNRPPQEQIDAAIQQLNGIFSPLDSELHRMKIKMQQEGETVASNSVLRVHGSAPPGRASAVMWGFQMGHGGSCQAAQGTRLASGSP